MTNAADTAFRVFSVAADNGTENSWFEIGAAFPHADGVGYDILLRAQPLTTKLVLRPEASVTPNQQSGPVVAAAEARLSLSDLVGAFERALIERCLAETGGKISHVMKRLNIPRRTLSEKMARYRISRRHFVRTSSKTADDIVRDRDHLTASQAGSPRDAKS
jgi:hypothetical protein